MAPCQPSMVCDALEHVHAPTSHTSLLDNSTAGTHKQHVPHTCWGSTCAKQAHTATHMSLLNTCAAVWLATCVYFAHVNTRQAQRRRMHTATHMSLLNACAAVWLAACVCFAHVNTRHVQRRRMHTATHMSYLTRAQLCGWLRASVSPMSTLDKRSAGACTQPHPCPYLTRAAVWLAACGCFAHVGTRHVRNRRTQPATHMSLLDTCKAGACIQPRTGHYSAHAQLYGWLHASVSHMLVLNTCETATHSQPHTCHYSTRAKQAHAHSHTHVIT